MDSSAYSKSDPLVVLLNEIEILLAQTRLMELHLKRAQAASDDKMTHLQEQYQEELNVLRSALAAGEENRAAQKHAAAQTLDLGERMQFLETQLAEERRVIENRDAEILRAKSDIADLENRVGQFEAANREIAANAQKLDSVRRSQEAEIAALRYQVTARERELTERGEAVTAVELALHGGIQSINQDLARSRREIKGQRVWSATARRRLEEESQRARNFSIEMERRLGTKDEELRALRAELDKQQSALEERNHELEHARRHQVERQALEHELAQERQNITELHRQILELKDPHRQAEALLKGREQDAATTETAASRGRLEQPESLRETERAVKANAEQAQAGLQTELAALRQEPQDEAWSRARQQAAIENLALAHKSQLQKLDTRIDEQQHAINDRDSELEKTRAQMQSLGRRLDHCKMSCGRPNGRRLTEPND